MADESKLKTDLIMDNPIELNARYRMDIHDRRRIDNQILAAEEHLVQSLLPGYHATWGTLDGSSDPVETGDCIVVKGNFVTKAIDPDLTNSGTVLGVVIIPALPGAKVRYAIVGSIPPSISGLTDGSQAQVICNPSTGRIERIVGLPAEDDFPVGFASTTGAVTINTRSSVTVTLVGGDATSATMSGTGSAGDVVCNALDAADEKKLTKATPSALAAAGIAVGFALEDWTDGQIINVAGPGTRVDISLGAPSFNKSSIVIVNSSAAGVRSNNPSPGDYAVGYSDSTRGYVTVDPKSPQIYEVNPCDPRWGAKANDSTFDSSDAIQRIYDTLGPDNVHIKHGPHTTLYYGKPIRIFGNNSTYDGAYKAGSKLEEFVPASGNRNRGPAIVLGPKQTLPLGSPIGLTPGDGPGWELDGGEHFVTLPLGKTGSVFIDDFFFGGITIEFALNVGDISDLLAAGPGIRQSILYSIGRIRLSEQLDSAFRFQLHSHGSGVVKLHVPVKVAPDKDATHGHLIEALVSSTVFTSDQEAHVRFSYDGTTLKLFINGVLESSYDTTDANGGTGVLHKRPWEEVGLGDEPSLCAHSGAPDVLGVKGRIGRVRFSNQLRDGNTNYTPPSTYAVDGSTTLLVRYDQVYTTAGGVETDILKIDGIAIGVGNIDCYVPALSRYYDQSRDRAGSGVSNLEIAGGGGAGILRQCQNKQSYIRAVHFTGSEYGLWSHNQCYLSNVDDVRAALNDGAKAAFMIGATFGDHGSIYRDVKTFGGEIGFLSMGNGGLKMQQGAANECLSYGFVDNGSLNIQLNGFTVDVETTGGTRLPAAYSLSETGSTVIIGAELPAGAEGVPVIIDGCVDTTLVGSLYKGNTTTRSVAHIERKPTSVVFLSGNSIGMLGLPTDAPQFEVSLREKLSIGGVPIGTAELRSGILLPPLDYDVSTTTGLAAWFKADTGITESGGDISAWDTAGGPSLTVSQATGANKPTYNATGGSQGGPCVSCDGARWLENTSANLFTAGEDRVVSWVGKLGAFGSPEGPTNDILNGGPIICSRLDDGMVCIGAAHAVGNARTWIAGPGLIDGTLPVYYNQSWVFAPPDAGEDLAVDTADWHVFTAWWREGKLAELRVDGRPQPGSLVGKDQIAETGTTGWSLLGSATIYASQPINYCGDVEEIITLNEDGSNMATIRIIEDYLLRKYSLGPWTGTVVQGGQWTESPGRIVNSLSYPAITPPTTDAMIGWTKDAEGIGTYREVALAIEDQDTDNPTKTLDIFGQKAYAFATGDNQIGGSVFISSGLGSDGLTGTKAGKTSISSTGAGLEFLAKQATSWANPELRLVGSRWSRWLIENLIIDDLVGVATTSATTADQTIAQIPIGAFGNDIRDIIVDVWASCNRGTGSVEGGRGTISQLITYNGTVLVELDTADGVVSGTGGQALGLKLVPNGGYLDLKVTPWSANSTDWGYAVQIKDRL